MRVLIFGNAILPEDTKSGHSTMVYTLSQGLKKSVDIVVLSYPSTKNYSVDMHGVKYYFTKRLRIPVLRMLYLILRAYPIKKKHNPEVIYTVGYGTMTYFISMFLRIPFIVHTIGTDVNSIIDREIMIKTGQIKNNLKDKIVYWHTVKYLKKAKAVTVGREYIKEKLKKIIKNNIHIVITPIDIELFKRKNIEKKNIVLFVGRIIPFKNIESIIEVAKFVGEAEFWIIGPIDNKNYYEKITELIKEKDIENVKFIGPVRKDELPSYYSMAKVYVHTSYPNTESMAPQTLLEALSCGLPVVAFENFGAETVLTDGLNGYLVNRDEKIMAEKVRVLLDNDNIRKKLSKNARKTAENFSVENSCRRIYDIIKSSKV